MLSFIVFHARTAIFFTILSYVLLGNRIDAEKVLNPLLNFFFFNIPFFLLLYIFIIYVYIFFKLQVFVLTSFYSSLRQTMTVFFPQAITQVAEGLISIRRIKVGILTLFCFIKKK